MAIPGRRFPDKASQRILLAMGLLCFPWTALAEHGFQLGFPLRNQNPFLHIFGLPPFQSATLATSGAVKYDLSLDLANHADAGDNEFENFVVDGETYFLTLSLRRGASDRVELGVDLPLVAHAQGFLDSAIENWHDVFGMSNTKRRGPGNQLNFSYAGNGNISYGLDSPSFGIGDIHLTAALSLREADDAGGLSIAVRTSIKLPTGNEEELLGSGAADLAVGVYAAGTRTLWKRDLEISGFVGGLLLGEGEILPTIQRSAVPYGGISATWHATENFGITTQLYAQGAYFDSEVEELGGNSLQLAVGGYYRLSGRGMTLGFAIVEDVSANATTDFALHFSLRSNGGR